MHINLMKLFLLIMFYSLLKSWANYNFGTIYIVCTVKSSLYESTIYLYNYYSYQINCSLRDIKLTRNIVFAILFKCSSFWRISKIFLLFILSFNCVWYEKHMRNLAAVLIFFTRKQNMVKIYNVEYDIAIVILFHVINMI